MYLIIISLILGLCIGCFQLLPTKIINLAHYLILGGLFILLFIMGFEIGINDKILNNLNLLGLKAILLASSSIIGSLIMVFLFSSGLKEEE